MTEQEILNTLDFFHAMGIITTCMIVCVSVFAVVELCGNLWHEKFGSQDGMATATHTIGADPAEPGGEQTTVSLVGPDGKVQQIVMTEVPMRPCENLMAAYEKYIALLGEEIGELSGLAATHGWQSKRYEAGLMARADIQAAWEDIKKSDCNKK